jgi:hypothetical protein
MRKTTKNIGKICTQEEFEQLKSIHERFSQYVRDEHSLRPEEFGKLFDDIEKFWPRIVSIGREAGIDVSDKLVTIMSILREPVLTNPSVYVGKWRGGPDWALDDAIAGEFAEYEAKLKKRRELIADLDKVMVNLYASLPEDKNQAPIFNIQNSNVILGGVHQAGNLQIGQGASIQDHRVTNSKNKRHFGTILEIIGVIINLLKSIFWHK